MSIYAIIINNLERDNQNDLANKRDDERNTMLTKNELKTYTQLMKTRFMEDPGVIYQVKDLDRAELLIEAQFEGQIQAFMEVNALQVI